MKLKLIISFSMWSILISSYINKKVTEPEPPCKTILNTTGKSELTEDEQRERMNYLLTGKSENYECESDFREVETGSVINDTSVFGNGASVIYCKAGKDKSGYVIKGIKLKNQEIDNNNKWLNDTLHSISIRLRLRIRQDLIYPLIEGISDQNMHTPICRLEIVNTKGMVIRSVEYAGQDFYIMNPENPGKLYYSGNYRERKGFLEYLDSTITVSGKEVNPGGIINTSNSKLDYRVFWYGYTDIWIDKVRIENEVSSAMLSGMYDGWIAEMDSINTAYIKSKIEFGNRNICTDYIISRLKAHLHN